MRPFVLAAALALLAAPPALAGAPTCGDELNVVVGGPSARASIIAYGQSVYANMNAIRVANGHGPVEPLTWDDLLKFWTDQCVARPRSTPFSEVIMDGYRFGETRTP